MARLATTPEQRERAIDLIRYLREFVQLRSKVVRSIKQYEKEGFVQWVAAIPRDHGCVSPLWSDLGDDGTWLEVRKQELSPAPAVPEVLARWVDPAGQGDPHQEQPPLRPQPTNGSEGEEVEDAVLEELEPEPARSDDEKGRERKVLELQEPIERMEDDPDALEAWNGYMERWQRWAAERRRQEPVQRLYSALFDAYQKQKRLGETFEFVIGFGLLSASMPHGQQPVDRHVLTARAELRFDSQKGMLSVHCPPPPEGAALRIEDDFLEPQEQPTREAYDAMTAHLGEIGDSIWDLEHMNVALRSWANTLFSDVEYSDAFDRPARATKRPTVVFAPAFILRRRRLSGILATYDKIIEQINDSGIVPFGFRRLVDHLEDDYGIAAEGEGREENGFEDPGVLFPLPANDQQRAIVHELTQRQGVLVQGPPGTGKSQTIANLLCHFLAKGKRVLVTSETARALAVLKNKIPEPLQALCVSLLGADTESLSELERSIGGIGRRFAQWRRSASRRRISELQELLEQRRRRLMEVRRELRTLRESATHPITVGQGRYRGTPEALGREVERQRPAYGWLQLPDAAPDSPPVRAAAVSRLHEILCSITEPRRSELEQSYPDIEDVPTVVQFNELTSTEEMATEEANRFAKLTSHAAYAPLSAADAARRAELRQRLTRFLSDRQVVLRRPEGWTETALEEVLSERESAWKVRLEQSKSALEALNEDLPRAAEVTVRWPKDIPLERVLADASDLLHHLRAGGRWSILGIPTPAARGKRYLRKEVQVNGRLPRSSEHLEDLVRVARSRKRLEEAWRRWSGHATPLAPDLETEAAELEEHVEALELVFGLLDQTRSMGELLAVEPAVSMPRWNSDQPEVLARVIKAIEAARAAHKASRSLDSVIERLEEVGPTAHPVCHRLVAALATRDMGKWREGLEQLNALRRDQAVWLEAQAIAQDLRGAVPEIVEELWRSPELDLWPHRLRSFDEAWDWAVAERWLRRHDDQEYFDRLVAELVDLERGEAETLEELATENAWLEFLVRLKPAEKESLEAWQLAVKQVGKGTGKYAEKHRREARRYMAGCIHAIPAWVVPRYRVAEVFAEPEPELFDVVIVDEASQTGIDGLFLYYLGRQTVIVGDHQQISPSGIGLAEHAVTQLQQRYLENIPFRAALQPTASLYDHAKIKFTGKIVLCEHFRCMPEIIQFSNDLCYASNGTPLIPLRTYPPDRLAPVETRFVPGGYQEGKAASALNRPEAKDLVDQIVACLDDPSYEGKTFGVISLLGGTQARYVQQLLLDRIGPETIEERELVCGDAYAFQGDERDVIFLTLVSAPNARIGPLTKDSAVQRFNVAASRARDQMWLFHSVRLDDLSQSDVRRRLLSYCLDPGRSTEDSEDRFESDLERDVCSMIRARGFRVVTQVEAGDQVSHRYRIDLVVEGMNHRLAVECDGDRWHGPEHYEADMARQRQLERAGWRFVRVRGGAFYSNRHKALEPLWKALHELGIEPQPPVATEFEQTVEAAQPHRRNPASSSGADGLLSSEISVVESGTSRWEGAREESAAPGPEKPDAKRTDGAEFVEVQSGDRTPLPPSDAEERPKDYTVEEEADDRAYVDAVPAEDLLELSHWAKRKGVLKGWQRKILYSVGRYKKRGWTPSTKQVRRVAEAHREAVGLGFEPSSSRQSKLFETRGEAGES